ncbi:3-deoxy-manno-octulosonate cytidylyltransferase [Amylibacter kogurei]|uniref:3-deoxy-manno-octulosonate cytidylyltransferase n=1 Tax=Paramylibacter kogurei TaxID=1889778 RepID=A0A2G5KC48_9RHOB|nr:manno-octulosonate cytidylyltransferase [Amylibacter kogurei]PIB26603.1 3-deoxy-manno-octulosonate cytidylyltransferase [Amylibacter kogurei]
MSVLVVVPARYGSSRFNGKPLAMLRGATGIEKPLIQRSWEAALKVPNARVVIATDDDRIKDVATGFGADVVMTSTSAKNGSERCAEAYETLGEEFEIVVNLQGDSPLTPSWFIPALIDGLHDAPLADVATPVLRCDAQMVAELKNDRMNGLVGGTTAAFDKTNRALYFSKEVIPYAENPDAEVYHHCGIYAYRPQSLRAYANWPESQLERQEGLEQMRFLAEGRHIQCVEVDAKGCVFWEVNNPEDVPRVESILLALGIE